MSEPYTPIDCAVYSGYELSIMHRETLRLRWRGPDGIEHLECLKPTDLRTEPTKEEFMIGIALNGSERRIRLDWIVCVGQIEASGDDDVCR